MNQGFDRIGARLLYNSTRDIVQSSQGTHFTEDLTMMYVYSCYAA